MPLVQRTPSGAISLPRPPDRRRFAPRSIDPVPHPARAPLAAAPQPPSLLGPSPLEQLGLRTASVAHDFNNVLSVIMVCAGEIAASDSGPARERAIEIREAAERGAELSRSLLENETPGDAQAQPVAIDVALIDSLPLIRRTLAPDTAISLSSEGHVPQVRLAPGELQRMLVNLAGNSRDAMPDGGSVAIRTALLPIPPGDPYLPTGWCVRIAFADTGTGMAPEVARQALDPYFSTKPGRDGTGLGLATVLALARSRSGDLRISTSPGSGTTVAIYLPAVRVGGQSLALGRPTS